MAQQRKLPVNDDLFEDDDAQYLLLLRPSQRRVAQEAWRNDVRMNRRMVNSVFSLAHVASQPLPRAAARG